MAKTVATFKSIRPKVDEAIRAGFTRSEFCDLEGISRHDWYAVKPKDFHWRKIQKSLGIELKNSRTTEEKPVEKPKEELVDLSSKFYADRLRLLANALSKVDSFGKQSDDMLGQINILYSIIKKMDVNLED